SDPQGPFRGCHPRLSPQEALESCLQDLCAAGGAREVLCGSLQAYTAACQAAGAQVESWRTESFCRESCPAASASQ
ncbi:FCGBP protein, partial [Semnornis frantzii]|nr:FCGBP protein [Semnornis frantzii]